MTNCSDDGQFRLANNPHMPTDSSKVFTNLSLFRREIAEYDLEAKYLAGEDPAKLHRSKINYLGWVLSDLRIVIFFIIRTVDIKNQNLFEVSPTPLNQNFFAIYVLVSFCLLVVNSRS